MNFLIFFILFLFEILLPCASRHYEEPPYALEGPAAGQAIADAPP